MQIKRKIKVVETAPCGHAMLVLEPEPFLLNKKVQNSPARKPLLRQPWGGGALYSSRLMIITVKTYYVKYARLYRDLHCKKC
jgi:hypothetical protein